MLDSEQENQSSVVSTIERDGFALVRGAVAETQLERLLEAIEDFRKGARAAGVRNLLSRCQAVREFAYASAVFEMAKSIVGKDAKAVRAILFDKTPTSNWYVTWHQDLAIPVVERCDIEGFGPWSVKDDVVHVQPPATVLEKMVSLRVHLDACAVENGAIKFIAGSHASGIMDQADIGRWKETHAEYVCATDRGDVIAMRPLILHSSSVAVSPEHRRVLHIEYAGVELPVPLRWAEA